MYNRLDNVPVYKHIDSTVGANYYNHVLVALKHLGDEVRYRIPKLKHLDLIIQHDAWIIVDRVLNDVPVAAWTNFQAAHRENLHEPIPCDLKLYHANAELVLDRTLEAMELLLGETMEELLPDNESEIVAFQDPGEKNDDND